MSGKAKQRATKRSVYVSGIFCESLAEAARTASKLLGREIQLWEIQRAVNENKTIDGLSVVDAKIVFSKRKTCINCLHCKKAHGYKNIAFCSKNKNKEYIELEYWQIKRTCNNYQSMDDE